MPRNKCSSRLAAAAAAATYIAALWLLLAAPAATAQATAPPPARAQADSGAIFGNVSDHQGAPLAGAQVTLTNLSTKETTNGSTDGTGAYSFDGLKPGHYSILFESKGLISKTQTLEVKPGKKSKVSERLKPPEVKEKRNVE
jgi:hypothetical protein